MERRLLVREADRAPLLGEGVRDRLPHPPDGVRDELDAAVGVEAAGGLDEADVPLVDEVEERDVGRVEPLRVGDDEPQVAAHELVDGLACRASSASRASG